MSEAINDVCDYLTLGDGDFTFSYDMLRFLQARLALMDSLGYEAKQGLDESSTKMEMKVICTGIDPFNELEQKYRDANFILKRISSLNGVVPSLSKCHAIGGSGDKSCGSVDPSCTHGSERNGSKRQRLERSRLSSASSRITISIHHSVNAIKKWHHGDELDHSSGLEPSPPLPSNCTFKNVIFNHPHIGNEDAQLHSRFLSHFFHSATNHWLAPGGVLHLTLADGQCERWECIERARQQGLELIQRQAFRSPLSPGQYIQQESKHLQLKIKLDDKIYRSKEDFLCRYQHRRGHCGRSFKSRVDGSETLSFGNKCDVAAKSIDETTANLPWQKLDYAQADKSSENTFNCPQCQKSFRDERARKNHIKSVHADGNDSSRKKKLTCDLCGKNSSSSPNAQRIFPNEEALEAHKRAKHSGAFEASKMKPAWAKESCAMESVKKDDSHLDGGVMDKLECQEPSDDLGECNICGLKFASIEMRQQHYGDFVPTFSTCSETSRHVCFACGHRFPQERSLIQHQLVCTFKKNIGVSR